MYLPWNWGDKKVIIRRVIADISENKVLLIHRNNYCECQFLLECNNFTLQSRTFDSKKDSLKTKIIETKQIFEIKKFEEKVNEVEGARNRMRNRIEKI